MLRPLPFRFHFARLARATAFAAALGLLVRCGGDAGPEGAPDGGASSGGTSGSAGNALGGRSGAPANSSSGSPAGGSSSVGGGASTGGVVATNGGTPASSGAPNGGRSAGGTPAAGSPAAGADPGGRGAGAGAGGTPSGGAGASTGGAPFTGGATGASGAPPAPSFILGADISSVQEAVDSGTRYADTDGTEKSLIEILKAHGFNYIRLRAFVDPNAEYGYARGTGSSCAKAEAYCDTAHTIEFAKEIKAAGLGYLLDLHYSDTWADPGKQIIPAAWRSATSISELATRLRDYTTDILTQHIAAGARPDMVQVGNEITPGMLIHVPNSNTDCWGNNASQNPIGGTASNGNWDNLATLIKAGVEAVRAVDPTIQVMLHIENTDDLAGARWWVENARSRDVEFDVLGLSCYTAFQGQPSVWRATLEALADDFPELKFAIAEYNPERSQANRILKELPNGRGVGSFFWEPTQSGSWGDSMFSSSGGVMRANADDFAEFDDLRVELGL